MMSRPSCCTWWSRLWEDCGEHALRTPMRAKKGRKEGERRAKGGREERERSACPRVCLHARHRLGDLVRAHDHPQPVDLTEAARDVWSEAHAPRTARRRASEALSRLRVRPHRVEEENVLGVVGRDGDGAAAVDGFHLLDGGRSSPTQAAVENQYFLVDARRQWQERKHILSKPHEGHES